MSEIFLQGHILSTAGDALTSPSEACCILNDDTNWLLCLYMSLDCDQTLDWKILPVSNKNAIQTQDTDACVTLCPKLSADYFIF
jgi:hypothetical protein